MNKKNSKKMPKGGLGRSLAELLSDNDEQVNMDSKVLMHKDDGSSVKIYNKPDSRTNRKNATRKFGDAPKMLENPTNAVSKELEFGSSRPSDAVDGSISFSNKGVDAATRQPIHNWRTEESRVEIGKSREERREEARGIYRHGKPHVVNDGEALSPIRISPNSPKREPESQRIVIGDGLNSGKMTTAEGLEQLDRYRPTVKDGFLEELLELSETTPSKSYETDGQGRIIIGSPNKAKVKRR